MSDSLGLVKVGSSRNRRRSSKVAKRALIDEPQTIDAIISTTDYAQQIETKTFDIDRDIYPPGRSKVIRGKTVGSYVFDPIAAMTPG